MLPMSNEQRKMIICSLPDRDPSEVEADIDEYERLLVERQDEVPCPESEMSDEQKNRRKRIRELWDKFRL